LDLIILTDGMYHLVPVTKIMLGDIKLVAEVNCFQLCDILRIKLSTYATDPLNAHVMNDGSGDFFGCICK
tara:strand:- start:367 stop:576 length:210 start_codon:yes stop_codon:yes gene_type:complete